MHTFRKDLNKITFYHQFQSTLFGLLGDRHIAKATKTRNTLYFDLIAAVGGEILDSTLAPVTDM